MLLNINPVVCLQLLCNYIILHIAQGMSVHAYKCVDQIISLAILFLYFCHPTVLYLTGSMMTGKMSQGQLRFVSYLIIS